MKINNGGGVDMLPLGLMSAGEKGEVLNITSKDHHAHHGYCHRKEKNILSKYARIEDMGLRAGKMVEILNNKGQGPLLIKIDNSRIAIGRGLAMKILVKRAA